MAFHLNRVLLFTMQHQRQNSHIHFHQELDLVLLRLPNKSWHPSDRESDKQNDLFTATFGHWNNSRVPVVPTTKATLGLLSHFLLFSMMFSTKVFQFLIWDLADFCLNRWLGYLTVFVFRSNSSSQLVELMGLFFINVVRRNKCLNFQLFQSHNENSHKNMFNSNLIIKHDFYYCRTKKTQILP